MYRLTFKIYVSGVFIIKMVGKLRKLIKFCSTKIHLSMLNVFADNDRAYKESYLKEN